MAAADALHPEQLKMFMTAREIQSSYDPHEGDRMHVGTMTPAHRDLSVTDPRAGELTHRSERTDQMANKVYPFAAGTYQRSNVTRIAQPRNPESNEQMWNRKLNESYVRTVPGDRSVSLYEHVQQHGVQSPIPLGQHPSPRTGKPMIAGGQHRVAVMAHLNPDQLMPVTHVTNVLEAISSKL